MRTWALCTIVALLLCFLSAGVAVGLGVAQASQTAGSSPGAAPETTLASISGEELERAGIILSPTSVKASVSSGSAGQTALDNTPRGSTVRETVLAQVTFGQGGINNRAMWVVSVGPPYSIHMENGDSPVPLFAKWDVAFVDPSTGSFVESALSSS